MVEMGGRVNLLLFFFNDFRSEFRSAAACCVEGLSARYGGQYNRIDRRMDRQMETIICV